MLDIKYNIRAVLAVQHIARLSAHKEQALSQ